ncbi:MAG: type I glyceraldehyde-3-phosphate dehydrogenase [Candidatus Micrarchaeota archaeon]
MKNLAINGFGRIGRMFLRAAIKDNSFMNQFDIVAVNDLTDAKTLAHLLKYDSVHGKVAYEVIAKEKSLSVNGHDIQILSEKTIEGLKWKEMGVDYVLESTGFYTDREQAQVHLSQGARKVLISAPAKNPDVTLVPGVNMQNYDKNTHNIISMASCTTNCLAPVAKVLDDNFKIKSGFMMTIHAYTNDQRILDLPHKDLRRARAAALSTIPTSTGAAKAIGEVLPQLKGKLDGLSLRVPVPDGSINDLTVQVERETSLEEANAMLKDAANNEMKGILEYSTEPLVSSDIIGNPASAIVDSQLTSVIKQPNSIKGNMLKVLAWYDNEWGYSSRLVDMFKML